MRTRRLAFASTMVLGLAMLGGSYAGTGASTALAFVPGGDVVSFPAADGTVLTGRIFGTGASIVVLSNMRDNDPVAWQRFAPALAANYTVLSYTYRYPVHSASLTPRMAKGAVSDLRGAVAFARSRGFSHIALIGASLGGLVTAKVAADAHVDAVVIIAAPIARTSYDLRVEPAELSGITSPKLFVVSDHDPVVDPALTRTMYELSPAPKMWQSYPSAAHGTGLLYAGFAQQLRSLLLSFLAGALAPS